VIENPVPFIPEEKRIPLLLIVIFKNFVVIVKDIPRLLTLSIIRRDKRNLLQNL